MRTGVFYLLAATSYIFAFSVQGRAGVNETVTTCNDTLDVGEDDPTNHYGNPPVGNSITDAKCVFSKDNRKGR
jgi:hypothetical protein